MKLDRFEDQELHFPVEVHMRLVCEADEAVAAGLQAAADELGFTDPVSRSNASRKGTYQSYAVSFTAHSKQHLREVDQVFRNVPGVKMVL